MAAADPKTAALGKANAGRGNQGPTAETEEAAGQAGGVSSFVSMESKVPDLNCFRLHQLRSLPKRPLWETFLLFQFG